MSIFANSKHRISAYRTYFRIAKANRDLFHQCRQTRVAREAAVGEDEIAEAFEAIERLTERRRRTALKLHAAIAEDSSINWLERRLSD